MKVPVSSLDTFIAKLSPPEEKLTGDRNPRMLLERAGKCIYNMNTCSYPAYRYPVTIKMVLHEDLQRCHPNPVCCFLDCGQIDGDDVELSVLECRVDIC